MGKLIVYLICAVSIVSVLLFVYSAYNKEEIELQTKPHNKLSIAHAVEDINTDEDIMSDGPVSLDQMKPMFQSSILCKRPKINNVEHKEAEYSDEWYDFEDDEDLEIDNVDDTNTPYQQQQSSRQPIANLTNRQAEFTRGIYIDFIYNPNYYRELLILKQVLLDIVQRNPQIGFFTIIIASRILQLLLSVLNTLADFHESATLS